MANREHVKVVRQGAAAIAEWRQRNPDVRLDLTGADLSQANLNGADLTRADLQAADLRWVDCSGAKLSKADLHGANCLGARLNKADLRVADCFRANLIDANLSRADLRGADLRLANLALANLTAAKLAKADLVGASLLQAKLIGTDLAEALLDATSLGNCDLSQATGLSAVNHEGPSSIGVDTLIASIRGAGNQLTPELETFFLGAGVPRELLAELPRIVAEVKYYSCFVCYGQPDVDFAKRLRDDLAARGVPCWLYALDATPGERTWREIGLKRREADKMVVICSAAALIRDGALKEIEEQIDDDPEKMVPISRDDIWIQPGFRVMRGSRDLGPFLRDRNYADFSDESRYDESLQRLLKALRRKAE